jgi:uncharacterized membrane protein
MQADKRLLLAFSAAGLAVFAYVSVIQQALGLPEFPGGRITITTLSLLAFSLAHSAYLLGWRRTGSFFAISTVVSWLFEQAGVATGLVFGAYHYTDVIGFKIGSVPLLVPLAWFMMIYPSYAIANVILRRKPGAVFRDSWGIAGASLLSSAVMTAWDLGLDPRMSGPSVLAWVWERGGAYFGVPYQNFVGWMATTFTVYLIFRWLESVRPDGYDEPLPASAMPLAAYGLMMLRYVMFPDPPEVAVIVAFAMGVPLLAAAMILSRPTGGGESPGKMAKKRILRMPLQHQEGAASLGGPSAGDHEKPRAGPKEPGASPPLMRTS